MDLKDKNNDLLAHDIYATAEILHNYCMDYLNESRRICTMTVLTEYLLTLSDELCKRF